MPARKRTISLVNLLLLAIVVAGLLPLIGIALSALKGYQVASDHATRETTAVLDDTALSVLQQRSRQTADDVGHFLDDCASETRTAALLPSTPAAFLRFADAHLRELWYVTGSITHPVERRGQFPVYREIVAVDANGTMLAHIVNGSLRSDSGDPAQIAAYVTEAKGLLPNALSVSHLVHLYTPRPNDQSTRLSGADYITFDGVYRIIAARHAADGTFSGAVMLALDARFLMDFVVHIIPTQFNHSIVWPDYATGNYAYLLDDEGWVIAHPNLWIIPGNDANGHRVSALANDTPLQERNNHPINTALAGWIDPNLPLLFGKALAGESGFVTTTNQNGARKVTAYAPIPFTEGEYRNHDAFGVVAIGANTEEFYGGAAAVAGAIENERQRLAIELGIAFVAALVLLVLAGAAINRMLVWPLNQLTAVARGLEKGEFDEARLTTINQRYNADEVNVLTTVFREMGRQVVRREKQLRTEIADLHIQIDSRRRQQQVDEITDTDYFRNLRDTATRMRSRPSPPPPPPPPAEGETP